jgi:hypothetical protein
MAFRTWARLLLATFGVGALAGASQLGLAYGLGILRLTRVLDVTTRDQWTAQLAWVAWFAMMAAVIGGLGGSWVWYSTSVTRRGPGGTIALAVAAAVGAAVVVPLTMQPARTAQIDGVHPVFVIGLCAALGALVGGFAAYAAIAHPVARWSLSTLGIAVWVIAIVSVLPTLTPDDPLPAIRLGVYDAGNLAPSVTQRTALFTMPAIALLAGAALGWIARRQQRSTLTIALAGLPGAALLTVSYLIAGPGSGADRYQVVPYWAAMTATGAGVLGSVLAAVIRRGDAAGPDDADPDPDAPTADRPPLPRRVGQPESAIAQAAAPPPPVSPAPAGSSASLVPGSPAPAGAPLLPADTGVFDIDTGNVRSAPASATGSAPSAGPSGPAGPGGGTGPGDGAGLGGAAAPTGRRGWGRGRKTNPAPGRPTDLGEAGPHGPAGGQTPGAPEASGAKPTGRRPSGPAARSGPTDSTRPNASTGSTGAFGSTGPADSTWRTDSTGAFGTTGPTGPAEPAGAPGRSGPATSWLGTDDRPDAARQGRPGGVAIGEFAGQEPSPFDGFSRPGRGADDRSTSTPSADSKPYVPAPATRPLPPEAIQQPDPAEPAPRGGLLGRSMRPFGRGKAGRNTLRDAAHHAEPAFPEPGSPQSGAPAFGSAPSGPARPGPAPARTPEVSTSANRPSLPPQSPPTWPTPAQPSRGERAPARGPFAPEPTAISAPLPQPDPITPPIATPKPVTPPSHAEPPADGRKQKGGKRDKDEDYVDWVSGLGGE